MRWGLHIICGLVGCLALVASQDARAQALAKADFGQGATVEITELRRIPDKEAVQLKFALVNGGGAPTSARKLGFATASRVDSLVLIDFANKRSYTIGGASRCLCSTFEDGGEVAPGQRREFWAWFGLPPANAKVLSIQIADQPPIADVPLQ